MLKNYTKIEVNDFGTKEYLNDEGKLHRLDGPAIEYTDGTKFWCINENRHRNIDPADEYSDGGKYWWFKGERHRVGGSFYSKFETWYIQGKQYTRQEYFNIVWNL